MKKLAFVFVALTLSGGLTEAQTFVDTHAVIGPADTTPVIDFNWARSLDKKNTVYVWGLGTKNWGELLLGYSRNVTPWMSIGFAAGAEKDERPWRVSPFIWIGKGKISLYTTCEDGGSGWWYLAVAKFKASDRYTFGLYSRKFVGTGPLVEVRVGGKLTVWSAYAFDSDTPKNRVGLPLKAVFGVRRDF